MTETTELEATPWLRFVGTNERGTPPMSGAKIEEDLELLRGLASIIVTQELRWAWYWKQVRKVLTNPRGNAAATRDRWRSTPGVAKGLAAPVLGASAVFHKGRTWRRIKVRRRLLHKGFRKISEARFLRRVALEHRATKLAVWAASCHNVVGGDRKTDSPKRRGILGVDLTVLDRDLDQVVASGLPAIYEIDANIARDSGASYERLVRIVESHGGTFHGDHGVEYLFTIPGRDVDVEVRRDWAIKPKHRGGRLNTDHEARGITFRLVRKRPR